MVSCLLLSFFTAIYIYLSKRSRRDKPGQFAGGRSGEVSGFVGARSALRRWEFVVLNVPLLQTLRLMYRQRSVGELPPADVAEDELWLAPLLHTWSIATLRHVTWPRVLIVVVKVCLILASRRDVVVSASTLYSTSTNHKRINVKQNI